jgi:hypothetical protein
MTEKEMQEMVGSVIARYREVSADFMEDDLSDEDARDVAEVVFKAICYEMGYVEGFAVLLGAEKMGRDSIRRSARRDGMSEALSHHDDGPCTGCPGSDMLRSELHSN